MNKCIFCKKHTTKGYYRCEITGTIRSYPCYYRQCKHYTGNWFNRFLDWLYNLLEKR